MLRGVLCVAVLFLAGADRAAAQAPQGPCTPAVDEVIWIREALDAWENVGWNLLASDPRPLPWLVLFNKECTFHLAPAQPPADFTRLDLPLSFVGVPITVYSLAHGGSVRLPNGTRVPIAPVATTSLYDRAQSTFFVMALPSIWKQRSKSSQDATLDAWMLGVLSHEMAHTPPARDGEPPHLGTEAGA